MIAQQGHRYLWCGVDEVLALESGSCVRVALIDPDQLWFEVRYNADASDLEPLPMRYFHGEVPR